jgi:RNA polymerase sigma factor for flagellar operon FliA
VARHVFLRTRALSSDWHDFVQNAFMGLMQAIDTFNPALGVPFRGYAIRRVRGAVFNGLRDLRRIGVSRPDSEMWRDRVESALDDGGDAIDQLVSAIGQLALGVMLQGSQDHPVAHPPTPYEHVQRDGLGRLLQRLMGELPERERRVLELHYLQFLPFAHIADLLAVTRGRISQLHHQGLARLRGKMAARQLADIL